MGVWVERSSWWVAPTGLPRADDVMETVHKLRAMLEAYHLRRAKRAGWTRRFIPTGLTQLDAALPHGGLPCGAVIEIIAADIGVGAMSLAMRIARQTTRLVEGRGDLQDLEKDRRSIVLIDTLDDFYPPAAWQWGISLDRLVVIRAGNSKDAFWAADQSLRCPAVAAVIAPLGEFDPLLSRRLQLAAESSGGLGLILTTARRRGKSFAAVRMLIEGVMPAGARIPSRTCRRVAEGTLPYGRVSVSADARLSARTMEDSHLCSITLLTVREGSPTEPFMVDLHHARTGARPVHPLPVDRPAAKTG